jgi:chaperone protein EcpD
MKSHRLISCTIVLAISSLAGLFAPSLQAGVFLNSTRVIYPAQESEITVSVNNDEKESPLLINAWIDDGREQDAPSQLDVPFLLTPPVFRLEPNKTQALRISYLKNKPLPSDKESVFWLNVLEVPPKPKAVNGKAPNTMQLAFRTRVKLFFRPQGLPGTAAEAPKNLRWKLVTEGGGPMLQADNPTPFYVSFESVSLKIGGKDIKSDHPQMVAPGGTQRFPLNNLHVTSDVQAQVHFASIGDYGQSTSHIAELTPLDGTR